MTGKLKITIGLTLNVDSDDYEVATLEEAALKQYGLLMDGTTDIGDLLWGDRPLEYKVEVVNETE